MAGDHELILAAGRVTLLSLGCPSMFPVLPAGGMLLPAWHRGSWVLLRIIYRVCFIPSEWGGSLD